VWFKKRGFFYMKNNNFFVKIVCSVVLLLGVNPIIRASETPLVIGAVVLGTVATMLQNTGTYKTYYEHKDRLAQAKQNEDMTINAQPLVTTGFEYRPTVEKKIDAIKRAERLGPKKSRKNWREINNSQSDELIAPTKKLMQPEEQANDYQEELVPTIEERIAGIEKRDQDGYKAMLKRQEPGRKINEHNWQNRLFTEDYVPNEPRSTREKLITNKDDWTRVEWDKK
jgi:hypothetical protein